MTAPKNYKKRKVKRQVWLLEGDDTYLKSHGISLAGLVRWVVMNIREYGHKTHRWDILNLVWYGGKKP